MLLVQKSQRVQSSKNLVFFLNAEREKFMFVKPNDIKASWAICFFQGNIFGAIQWIVLMLILEQSPGGGSKKQPVVHWPDLLC